MNVFIALACYFLGVAVGLWLGYLFWYEKVRRP